MNPSDVISLAQPYFAGRLAALNYFGNIHVAAPRLWKDGEKLHTPKSILEAVNNALSGLKMTGGKCGAAVRVIQPTLEITKSSGREGSLTLLSRVEVNPTLNWGPRGTQKFAQDIAYQVLRAGMGYTLLQGFCTLYADGDCFLPYTNEELGYETVDVILRANLAVSPLPACQTPQITTVGETVTLTNLTAGATIYYVIAPPSWTGADRLSTIFPGPQTAEAQVYGAPFTITAGDAVIWAAYLDGYAGSNVGFAQF